MTTRTVTLELLRHGAATGEVLSTLTPYLALAGRRAAETVHFECDRREMRRLLSALRYRSGHVATEAELRAVAAPVIRMLSGIHGLREELSVAANGATEIVHLRIVSSAAELAHLPFELLIASDLPAAPQLVITREARRAPSFRVDWSRRPRVLFASASPAASPLDPALLAAHYVALGEACAPWLVERDAAELEQYVTVLPRASLASIRRACAAQPFTHVHILAHGAEMPDEEDDGTHYGLALHADDGAGAGAGAGVNVVRGAELADALKSVSRGEVVCPTVVTLASCDGGNPGSVLSPEASVAQQLHEAGIPLVLASQLPLSERGSVVMTKLVYAQLFQGHDPRVVLRELRAELRTRCDTTHDWVSVVAYASFPEDIDAQVSRTQLLRGRRVVDAALSRLDRAERIGGTSAAPESAVRALEAALRRLTEAGVPEGPAAGDRTRRVEVLGLLANAKKRWAELLHGAAPVATGDGRREPQADAARFREGTADGVWTAPRTVEGALIDARDDYLTAFRLSPVESWAAVQALAIDAALGEPLDARLWTAASVIAGESAHDDDDRPRRIWATSSLVELHVLAQLLPSGHSAHAQAATAAEHLHAMLAMAKPTSFDAYSLHRQLRRYVEWWWKDQPALTELPRSLLGELRRRGVAASWESA